MDNNVAIRIKNLSKVYRIYKKHNDRVKEAFSFTRKKYHRDFYALNNISLDILAGQTLGVVGKNGSGKSTLLKLITKVTSPTEGSVVVNGTVSALLELGAGMNPEYTGLQNIKLNGAIMGFTSEEIEERTKEIIKFADIGDFINQPLKTYSSGMFMRLGFSIAININPDILIVDEALAVGDIFFQAKCYKKIQEFRKMGKTIILVTHSMDNILKYCDKVLVLNKGHMVDFGEPNVMVDLYKKILVGLHDSDNKELIKHDMKVDELKLQHRYKEFMMLNPNKEEYGNGDATIVDFGITDEFGSPTTNIISSNKFNVHMTVKFHKRVEDPIFAFAIKDPHGVEIGGTNNAMANANVGICEEGQEYHITFTQRMPIRGTFLLSLGCTHYINMELEVMHRIYDLLSLDFVTSKEFTGQYNPNSKITID